MSIRMKHEQLALVQGMADTRAALRRWNRAPGSVLGPWGLLSLGVALALLFATWAVASLSEPDPTWLPLPGVHRPARLDDYAFVLARNGLVLALHALACVAGFMAGSSLPTVAQGHSGVWRRIHELAGPLAIGFVVCATMFSLITQAYVLGGDAATIADQLGISPYELLAILSLHAIPELFALFLPLAAWTLASRRRQWQDLLAATAVTVAVAVPIILLAGAVETWVTPILLRSV